MLEALRAGLASASDMAMSVSFLRYSGLQLIVDDLVKFTASGGCARILTSTYLGITQPEALRALSTIDGVSVRVHVAQQKGAAGFHPKFVVFQGTERECWVGSSNLSKGGLTANVEANMRHMDGAVVDEVLCAFDELWDREATIALDANFTDAYAKALADAFIDRAFVPLKLQLPQVDPVPSVSSGSYSPNEAQREAIESLRKLRRLGERRAVVIAAPGVGKTFLAAFDARGAGANSVLFVSHRLEHLTQAKDTFASVFGPEFTTGLVYGGAKDFDADLVFTTIQSASRSGEALTSRGFDYVVVDEFHHAAADSYRRLLDELEPGFLLGITATPERADGHDVLAICDHNLAYEVRLIEAINHGWLMPFHYFGISDDTVDYDAAFWRKRRFIPEKMENALMLEERVDHVLEHALLKGYDGPRRATVGFCAGVRHAHFMREALDRRGYVAAALTGADGLEDRQQIYARLEDPEDPLEWLFVADLLNEGVDIPGINSLLFLRPTDSATVFIQQLGRGLRLSPNCEVLTVLDFVGRHRNAWLTMEALNDRSGAAGPRDHKDLELRPPANCEIVLDERTTEILRKVKKQSTTKRDGCAEAYKSLRQEMGPPFPVDLLNRADVPDLGDFRSVFGSWLDLRKEMKDAEPWEVAIETHTPAYDLLKLAELNWQQPRVYAYALFWGLCHSPDEPAQGYEAFFERFPRWRPEYAEPSETKVWKSLEKRLGALLDGRCLAGEVLRAIPADQLLQQVEARLRYTLDGDFQTRHGGVLRDPGHLRLHRQYARPEIINHFGLQYDPARHNQGVIRFKEDEPHPDHIVLITKIDTSGAKTEFQYENGFEDERTFRWQSQNRQRQDNRSGRRILDHRENGVTLQLFAQPRSHAAPSYLGPVDVIGVDGSAPMNVTFRLRQPVPELVLEALKS